MKTHRAIIQQLPLFNGKHLSVTELKGGLTNTNYKIRVGKKTYVARFAPEDAATLGVNKTRELENCEIAEKLGVGPRPVQFFSEHGLLLLEYVQGTVSNAKRIGTRNSIKALASLFRKLHSGPRLKGDIDIFEQTRQYFVTAKNIGAWMPRNSAYLISSINMLEKKLKKKSWIKPAHLDLMIANVVHTKKGLKLIDWEYAGNADCRYDLAMISFKAKFNLAQDRLLLKHYRSPAFTLHQLELMKCVVALREGSWGLVQIKLSNIWHDYKKHAVSHLTRFNKMARRLSQT